MTERGLPIVDGAPACPFVAFEDDRDGRATAPDHRHRCFAEPRPAPRALAHQEAYCLSSAFPVCPTFQDWARREAAATRPIPPEDRPPRDEPPVSTPMPPLEREPRHAPGTETPPPIPPRRNPPRDWAAPPPWSAEDGGPAEPPPFLSGRDDADYGMAARGLAGSAADRLAGPDPDLPQGAVPVGAAGAQAYAEPAHRSSREDDLDEDDLGAAAPAAAPAAGAALAGSAVSSAGSESTAPSASPAGVASQASRPRPAPVDPRAIDDRYDRYDDDRYTRSDGATSSAERPSGPPRASRRDPARRPEEEAAGLFGPAWEKPRRYEAYPTLRTRVGLPSVSRIWLWLGAIVLVGVVLFFAGPMLLGLGGGISPGGAGAGATPSASAGPSVSIAPTVPPPPTPQAYVVAKGDTLSKIAKKFGLTMEQLLAANPQIKNPDKIAIGDTITIPVPTASDETSAESPSAAP